MFTCHPEVECSILHSDNICGSRAVPAWQMFAIELCSAVLTEYLERLFINIFGLHIATANYS